MKPRAHDHSLLNLNYIYDPKFLKLKQHFFLSLLYITTRTLNHPQLNALQPHV